MTDKNYHLNERSNVFGSLIEDTVCTNIQQEVQDIEQSITDVIHLLTRTSEEGGTIYVVGNGGSAAVASHAVTDFVNACHLRAFTLHESSLITCMTNDFGYETAFKLILKSVFRKNDVLITISSSGQSPNMHQSADFAQNLG